MSKQTVISALFHAPAEYAGNGVANGQQGVRQSAFALLSLGVPFCLGVANHVVWQARMAQPFILVNAVSGFQWNAVSRLPACGQYQPGAWLRYGRVPNGTGAGAGHPGGAAAGRGPVGGGRPRGLRAACRLAQGCAAPQQGSIAFLVQARPGGAAARPDPADGASGLHVWPVRGPCPGARTGSGSTGPSFTGAAASGTGFNIHSRPL